MLLGCRRHVNHYGCAQCGKKGHVVCGNCGGRGDVTCGACSGQGDVHCHVCAGSGQVVKLTPDGRGGWNQTRVTCRNCYSGYLRCDGCGGRRTRGCNTCGGDGWLYCTPCGKTGWMSAVTKTRINVTYHIEWHELSSKSVTEEIRSFCKQIGYPKISQHCTRTDPKVFIDASEKTVRSRYSFEAAHVIHKVSSEGSHLNVTQVGTNHTLISDSGTLDSVVVEEITLFADRVIHLKAWSPDYATACHPPVGGSDTRPNTTDRGKLGCKHHIFVDRRGVPLVAQISGANVHNSRMLQSLIIALPAVGGLAAFAHPANTGGNQP